MGGWKRSRRHRRRQGSRSVRDRKPVAHLRVRLAARCLGRRNAKDSGKHGRRLQAIARIRFSGGRREGEESVRRWKQREQNPDSEQGIRSGQDYGSLRQGKSRVLKKKTISRFSARVFANTSGGIPRRGKTRRREGFASQLSCLSFPQQAWFFPRAFFAPGYGRRPQHGTGCRCLLPGRSPAPGRALAKKLLATARRKPLSGRTLLALLPHAPCTQANKKGF